MLSSERNKTEKNFSSGKEEGEETFWNIDGRIYFKGNCSNGLKNGEWVRSFQNGDSMKIYYEKGNIISKPLGGIVKDE